MRLLSAVAKRSTSFEAIRVVTMTLSLAIVAAVPLMGIVRIDLWQGHHLRLQEGVDGIGALKGMVIALSILYGFTFLTNMVVGRFFCGFGCPVGYVSRLGEKVDRARKTRWLRWLEHLRGAGFVAAFVAAVMLWWVDPRVLLDGSLRARILTLGIWAALSAGGFFHAFWWRFAFCVKACPIGLYYRYVTSKAPVGIVFNESPSKCIECGACETICPVDLDPKRLGESLVVRDSDGYEDERYGDAECLRCGDCVAACLLVFAKRQGEVAPLRIGRLTPHKHETPTANQSKISA